MSATLSWFNSGLGTKTGTTNAALFDDLVTLINSKSGDSNFKWQVASSNSGSSPLYIVLKPKDASAGRILLVLWSSAPAGNNAAILDAAPTTDNLYGAYFPSGNVDTPSNLTASSGTIMGNDSGAVKVWGGLGRTSIYPASYQAFYFDSAEAVYFGFQNPATATLMYLGAAGKIIVDASDNEYSAVFSTGVAVSASSFGSTTPPFPWITSTVNAGSTTACVRTNYGASNRVYFQGWMPSGPWGAQAVGAADILTDTANAKAWFVPMQLLGQAKGQGFVIKLRQIAIGPGTLAAFTVYNTTGPTVAARQFNAATAGGNGHPWLTNFKL